MKQPINESDALMDKGIEVYDYLIQNPKEIGTFQFTSHLQFKNLDRNKLKPNEAAQLNKFMTDYKKREWDKRIKMIEMTMIFRSII